MRKLYILAIVYFAALVALIIGLTTVRAIRVAAANRLASGQKTTTEDAAKQDGASDDEDDKPKVIRFASNAGPMPPFLVNDVDGGVVSSAEWRGRVVIVNFWATWCPPCREEIPEMIDLANRFRDRLQIIGVSEDDDATPEEVRDFAHNQKINYPIVMGSAGVSKEYGGVPALPTSFIVDTNGRVVQKHVGLYSPAVYDLEIRALLGEHVDVPIQTFVDQGQIFLKNAENATELPGVDLKGLNVEQKRAALKRLNTQNCTCGCKMTIAQCRIVDPDCSTSEHLAAQVVRQVAAVRAASAPTSTAR